VAAIDPLDDLCLQRIGRNGGFRLSRNHMSRGERDGSQKRSA
jgi:hypothetical protein